MDSKKLSKKTCEACSKGTPALKGNELETLHRGLKEGWKIINTHHLEKEYTFKDFRDALAFVNKVGEIAEQEGHHPDIYLSWGKAKIQLWTHEINGLSENDFILAAKMDGLK